MKICLSYFTIFYLSAELYCNELQVPLPRRNNPKRPIEAERPAMEILIKHDPLVVRPYILGNKSGWKHTDVYQVVQILAAITL